MYCRFGTIGLLFIPALAWVGFNIFSPALNQLARQDEIKEAAVGSVARVSRKKRGVAGAVGLGAALSLFAAQQADAATEVAQLAASDNRYVQRLAAPAAFKVNVTAAFPFESLNVGQPTPFVLG